MPLLCQFNDQNAAKCLKCPRTTKNKFWLRRSADKCQLIQHTPPEISLFSVEDYSHTITFRIYQHIPTHIMTALVQERKPLHLERPHGILSASSVNRPAVQDAKAGDMTVAGNLALPSLYDEAEFEDACSQDETASSASIESYISADETDDSIELGSCCQHPKRVTWSPIVVTEIRYRLKTLPSDKQLLHYTRAEMSTFRQEYKMQIRAVLKIKREQEASRREEDADRSSNLNPISGMINMMSSYLMKPSPTTIMPSSNSSSISVARKRLETSVLVDTLYLF
jgi:hypothetical protein